MNTRTFALIFGIVFLIIGAAGFLPGVTLMPPHSHPDIKIESFFGYELGLFPVNVLHNVVHLAIGVAGVAVYNSFASARLYARALAVVFALLTILGLIPGLNTTFGLIPIFGNDVWLHALTAALAAYFGFRSTADIERREYATRS